MRSTTSVTTFSSQLGPFYEPTSRRERADLEHNQDGFHPPRVDRPVCEHFQVRPHKCAAGRNAREAAYCRQEQSSFRCDRCASVSRRRRCCSSLRAGSVMSVLLDIVARYEPTDKLNVESTKYQRAPKALFRDLVACTTTVRRHEVIVQCGFFGVVHDERDDPLVQTPIAFWILSLLSEQQLLGMKPSCNAAPLMLSTTSSAFHGSNLPSDLGFCVPSTFGNQVDDKLTTGGVNTA